MECVGICYIIWGKTQSHDEQLLCFHFCRIFLNGLLDIGNYVRTYSVIRSDVALPIPVCAWWGLAQ